MITTEQIAKKLGLSRGTVSRALNNNPNVSQQTRELVLREVVESGYIANEAARSLVLQKKIKIAVVVFSEPAFFWKQIETGVNQIASEILHFGATVDFFTTDILNEYEQVELINTLVEKGYNGIALAPNNTSLMLEHVDKTMESGTPIILFNVDIPTSNRLCYVGSDYINAGALAAEIMAKSIGRKGNILIVALKEQVSAIDQRVIGFRNEIAMEQNVCVKEIIRFNRSSENVYEEMSRLLQTYEQNGDEINGIYVCTGVLEQVGNAVIDSKKNICVIGYDLSDGIRKLLISGGITAAICHEPVNQGYLAVRMLYQYLYKGVKPTSSTIRTKLEVVYKNNLDCYMEYLI